MYISTSQSLSIQMCNELVHFSTGIFIEIEKRNLEFATNMNSEVWGTYV